MGKDGFVWFMGVVEDRQDPLELGRCRVRCLGFHTDDKLFIPTEKLPWAMPVQPITSAAMNGIGQSPLGPVEGSWVVGFFRDGPNAQQPIFFGTVGGYPQEIADISKGKISKRRFSCRTRHQQVSKRCNSRYNSRTENK